MWRGNVIQAILKAGCVLKGEFRLSSGKVSDVYVDLRKLYSHPREVKIVAEELAKHASSVGCDVIAGIETGGIPLATMVAFILDKPLIYVRKKPKEHGTQKLIEGDASLGGLSLIVDDVATTGSSLIRAVNALRESGFYVENALVVVDRGEGAEQALKGLGVNLRSLTTLKDLLQAMNTA